MIRKYYLFSSLAGLLLFAMLVFVAKEHGASESQQVSSSGETAGTNDPFERILNQMLGQNSTELTELIKTLSELLSERVAARTSAAKALVELKVAEKVAEIEKKHKLIRFSMAVFPISLETAFRTAMLVEMTLGRVPVMVDKVGGVLTTSISPQQMLSGSTFVSYYFEPLGKDQTRVYIRTKSFYFSEGLSPLLEGGWRTDDILWGTINHLLTVTFYVLVAKKKDLEMKEVMQKLSDPNSLIEEVRYEGMKKLFQTFIK